MEKVSSLASAFKIFEVAGIQHFSLKSVTDETKVPSKTKRILTFLHYCTVWILYLSSLVFIIFAKIFDSDSGSEYLEQNKLSFLLELVRVLSGFAAAFSNLVLSWNENQSFVKFFMNAEMISDVWNKEFDRQISYKKLEQTFKVLFGFFLIICAIAVFITVNSCIKESPDHLLLFLNLWKIIPRLVVNVIILKFNFHVRIINFHLNIMRQMIVETYLDNDETTNSKIIRVKEVNSQKPKKALMLQNVFSAIKEMCDQISSSMGLPILFLLVMIFVTFVKSVYAFFMIASGNWDDDGIRREYWKILFITESSEEFFFKQKF
jgi:7tm Chemosensory receptor